MCDNISEDSVNKDNRDTFANNLLCLRKAKNMNQDDLAKILEISRSTISLYETGDKKPSYKILYKIGEYFNVSLNWLMGIPDNNS